MGDQDVIAPVMHADDVCSIYIFHICVIIKTHSNESESRKERYVMLADSLWFANVTVIYISYYISILLFWHLRALFH